ncbi:hypothetical protein [Nonomuraea sp. NPDC005692]|uniref:hypothetical protein n=1 Tax=Nonomuraea sp. NPDC005692 TaxID=3157168 RepID=UPI0033C9372F
MTKPSDSRAPLTPSALVRCGPSGDVPVISASAVGPIMAAATPCPARAATPMTNNRRLPTMSDARPNSGINSRGVGSGAVASRAVVS